MYSVRVMKVVWAAKRKKVDAWRARQEHDDQWFPLHQWSRTPGEEPTAPSRPVEPPPTSRRADPHEPTEQTGPTDATGGGP